MRDGVHAFAGLNYVDWVHVFTVGIFLLLLQVDNLARLENGIDIALVVFRKALGLDANLFGYGAIGVALACIEIIVLVVNLDGMQVGLRLRAFPGVLRHKLVVGFGAVEFVELV